MSQTVTDTMRGDSNHVPPPPATNGGCPPNSDLLPEFGISPDENGQQTPIVTPDMLYKLSKKIAQLTKVIYSLNTKNDDLETDLDMMRSAYEDKLRMAQQQLSLATSNLQQQLIQPNGQEGGGLSNGSPDQNEAESEMKREMKKLRQSLKQTEAKVKAMEEEILEKKQEMDRLHKEAAARSTTPTTNGDANKMTQLEQKIGLLEQQLKQLSRDKLELQMKFDRIDILRENLRLERDMLKKDITELTQDKNGLQLQLSAARIQLSYNREMGIGNNGNGNGKGSSDGEKVSATKSAENDDFADELIAKIEVLTKEKSELIKSLESSESVRQRLQKELEQMSVSKSQPDVTSPSLHKKCDAEKFQLTHKISQLESSLTEMSESHERQLATLREDKERALELMSRRHEEEQEDSRLLIAREKSKYEHEMSLNETSVSELRSNLDEKAKRCVEVERQLADVQRERDVAVADASARAEELASARSSLSELEERESALAAELSQIRDRELMFRAEMGQNVEKLCALEERCKSVESERDELKRRCKEIEAKMEVMTRAVTRDRDERIQQLERALEEALVEREEILEACEKEIQHEKTICIETEQKMMDDFEWKLREIEAEYRGKIKEAEDASRAAQLEYAHVKDEEFTRLSIGVRRDMEEKLRLERTSLKQALDTQHKADLEKALEHERNESRRELRILQNSWDDERARLEREVRSLKRKIEDLENEAQKRRYDVDNQILEERRKTEIATLRLQQEIAAVRSEAETRLEALRARHADEIAGYEKRLEAANDNRMSAMFQMREEVETEFSERMETLRNMYMNEIESQAAKMEEEKAKANRTEISLRAMLQERQTEVDELNSYYTQQSDEYEAKITELLTRLQEQTTLAIKLQTEIDEYEWYEEEEEEEKPETTTAAATGRRQVSRPSSTRPLDQHRIPEVVLSASPAPAHSAESPMSDRNMQAAMAASSVASLASTASYASADERPAESGHGATTAATPDSLHSYVSSSSYSPSQPEPPPRASSVANRRSWNPEASESPAPQHHTKRSSVSSSTSSTTTTAAPAATKKSQCTHQ